jgi:hypothetical protein
MWYSAAYLHDLVVGQKGLLAVELFGVGQVQQAEELVLPHMRQHYVF